MGVEWQEADWGQRTVFVIGALYWAAMVAPAVVVGARHRRPAGHPRDRGTGHGAHAMTDPALIEAVERDFIAAWWLLAEVTRI